MLKMVDLFINVNGIKICYEVLGQGFPVLMLHGFGMHKGFWFAQVDALSKKFKLILMDNRGSGNSDHPVGPYSMDTLVEDLNGLLNHLEIDKVHLIGWAMGSFISQYYVINHPNRVNKLVLMASLTKLPQSKSGLEMFKKSQLTFQEEKLKDPDNAFYSKMKLRFSRSFFKQMVEDPDKKFHDIFSMNDLREQVFKDNSLPIDIENRINAVAKINTIEKISKIKNETLILAADRDRITPKSSSIEMHEHMINSTLKILNGGHYFPLECAPEVNDMIIDFLQL